MSAIRVASWPHWYDTNRYLLLFYDALRPYGIDHVRDVPLTRRAFGPTGAADTLHLHWPEARWRNGPRTRAGRLAAVAGLRVFLAGLRRRGVPVVWTVHNLAPHGESALADRLGYSLLHRYADLRIFHSEWSRERALSGADRGRGDTILMPHGSYFGALPEPAPAGATRAGLGVRPAARLLLCFGQVRPYKGFDVAVQALDLLPNGGFHLVVAGRGIEGGEIGLLRRAAGRTDVTLLLEEQSEQRLADMLAAADAVLLPYREVTTSGALMLALTAGRAVVASPLPYFREVMAHGPEAVEWAATGDPRSLADAVTRFFAEDPASRHLAAARLAERYRWEAIVDPVAKWIVDRAR